MGETFDGMAVSGDETRAGAGPLFLSPAEMLAAVRAAHGRAVVARIEAERLDALGADLEAQDAWIDSDEALADLMAAVTDVIESGLWGRLEALVKGA